MRSVAERNTSGRSAEHLCGTNDEIAVFTKKKILNTGISIKHFCTTKDASGTKDKDWYDVIEGCGKVVDIAPSSIPTFLEWKRFNPRRELFRKKERLSIFEKIGLFRFLVNNQFVIQKIEIRSMGPMGVVIITKE